MGSIKIGRYDSPAGFAGWIEDGEGKWITFLDEDGRPSVHYAERDSSGAVVGLGVSL